MEKDIILCVENLNYICFQLNRIKLLLPLNGETTQQNEESSTSYSPILNANWQFDEPYMKYISIVYSTKEMNKPHVFFFLKCNLRITQEYSQPKIVGK